MRSSSGLGARVGGLRIEFIEDGDAGGEEEAFRAKIAQRLDEFLHALVEARAEFFEPGFLAGGAAQRITLSADGEFCLGHGPTAFQAPVCRLSDIPRPPGAAGPR